MNTQGSNSPFILRISYFIIHPLSDVVTGDGPRLPVTGVPINATFSGSGWAADREILPISVIYVLTTGGSRAILRQCEDEEVRGHSHGGIAHLYRWFVVIPITAVIVGLMSVGQMEPLPHLGSLTEQLRGPARLAVAPDDSVFVSDPLNRHIARFDASGVLADLWPVPSGPIGVGVHPDGRIFVSLRDEPKVAVYDSVFQFVEYLGEDEPLVSFAGPTDIDIAADTGRIYVVDAEGDRIYGFDSDGGLALILGTRGSEPGQFIYPSAITIDEPRNRIIIADHDKFRIHVFTTAGVFLQQFGDRLKSTDGGLEGWMPRPLGLTVDADGHIYVTDALMGTVRVFGSTGLELGKIVEYGYEPGKLRIPCDLAVSNDGSRLYVASTGSSRVEIYDLTDGGCADGGHGGTSTTNQLWSLPRTLDDMQGGVAAQQDYEDWLDGPHRVEDRPDLCEPCHRINGQPGTHGGTVEGQSVLCMSCHSTGGRALNVIIHERDMADPFGTNAAAVDGLGRSHAWGVPAVNPMADSVGPMPGSMYLDPDGNIKCSTCHNQHSTYYGPLYLQVSNDADAMCKECHAPRDRGVGDGGSHPVGFAYPGGDGEYPASDQVAPLFIKDGSVECMTCHAPHGADSGGTGGGDGDGMLLRSLNDETLCRTCHTEHTIHEVPGEWQPTCHECHGIHDTENGNVVLIAREINGASVTFVESSIPGDGQRDYIHGICDPPNFDGVCEVCHTDTDYHRGDLELDHTHNEDRPCTECHVHSTGFLTSCTDCHGEPPDGTVFPNQAGSHAVHLTAINGPDVADCYACHAWEEIATHDNGVVSFASGVDANLDGNIDLAEADVCNTCHSDGGPFDGVNDPVIGAKANWADGVYDGDVLNPDRQDWCLGCHDTPPALVNEVEAPQLAGDNRTWGYNVAGHGQNQIVCTECHDPALSHTDGVARTFRERCKHSPLPPTDEDEFAEERELAKEAYNSGYRLRRINGGRALEVPRDSVGYTADDFRLCFSCHDEIKILGVPDNYGFLLAVPPSHLQLPEGVAQTNFRNEYKWGYGWLWYGGKPANIHWNLTGLGSSNWDIDHNDTTQDSRNSCVTCHNPHGARLANEEPTAARTMVDLAISFGVYNDGTVDREYGYIDSGGYVEPGGDLHCAACHSFFGPGQALPVPGSHTRYYREWLDLHGNLLHDQSGKTARDARSRIEEGE